MRMGLTILTLVLLWFGGAPAWSEDCGVDYMLPGVRVPMEVQTFQVLAADGAHHIIVDHLVGPPPHNYQYILRVRLDDAEMEAYKKMSAGQKELAGLVSVAMFCPADVKAMFGTKTDRFAKNFPMKAAFIAPGAQAPLVTSDISIERDDVEVMVFRYLPSLLPQDVFRRALVERSKEILPYINNAPLYATESVSAASGRSSYITSDGIISKPGESCPSTPEVKGVTEPKTMHTFLLLAELGSNSVMAVHYLDQAPQNFQMAFRLRLSKKEMRIYRGAKNDTTVPPVMQTRILPNRNYYFCLADFSKVKRPNGSRFAPRFFAPPL